MKNRLVLLAATFIWICAIGVGLRIVAAYENTPGHAGPSAIQWPATSRIQRAPNHPTLIMLAHPKCPCTRASVSELAQIMARCQGKLTTYVLFYKPQGASEAWVQTDLWRSAADIPGVQVVSDAGGIEARRFHVETSGHTVLYDTAGHLLFSGGITAARGQAGENAGRSAIESLLTTGVLERSKTLVFGCSVVTPNKVNAK
jgi:hypothetical protein